MEAKRQEQLEAAAAASSERLLRKKDEVRVVAETQRRLEKARADLAHHAGEVERLTAALARLG